jgi:hypothetical protein
MPIVECERSKANIATCNCSYEPCSRKGNCCLCLSYHLSHGELPACFFPEDVERTYNRSQRKFVELFRGGFRPTMEAVSHDGAECPRKEENLKTCACTYEPCDRRGICCLCLRYHLSKKELPACVRGIV